MNEPDTAGILRRDALTSAGSGTDEPGPTQETVPTTCFPRPPIRFTCSPVTVEPVVFLVMFSVALNVPLSTQYVWERISEDLGFNGSKTSGCSNESLPPDPVAKVG